jgi:hypothetical protein
MTPKEIEAMLPSGHKATIRQVVDVMMKLRSMNVDVIDHMLETHRVTLGFMPDEIKPAFEGMITDLVLIKAFIEQAKAYNKTEEGEKAFERVFGKIEDLIK